MGKEIERKFLVDRAKWDPDQSGTVYRQGYVANLPDKSVRVRIAGEKAMLTLKGGKTLVRDEYEYPIPVAEARELLERFCEKPLIEKTRYRVRYGNHLWEVDVFHGENEGLFLAEIELGDPSEVFDKPAWAGKEVTGDKRYYNANLGRHPYRDW